MAEVASKAGDASGNLSDVQNVGGGFLGGLKNKAQGLVDGIFPPQKRQAWKEWLINFAVNNPKLSAFLLTNIALTGLPLGLFILFTISVAVFSLLAALIIGLLVAVLFIVFCVGVALIIVLPTVFFTTMASTFIFLWGLGGYYIFKWFNESGPPAEKGQAIGDQLNGLTGGKLGWLVDGARTKEEGKTSVAKDMPHLNGHSDGQQTQTKSKGGRGGDDTGKPPKLKDQHAGDKAQKSTGSATSKAGGVSTTASSAQNAAG